MSEHRFRAITTRYKGYNFRSRLEARWAVFFDHLNIRWDYEPEGFELGNGMRYLPDFWLPDWKMWVEIKPAECDDAAREKAWRLAEQSKFPVYMSNGLPDGPGSLFVTMNHDPDIDPRGEYHVVVGWHLEPKRGIVITDPRGHYRAKVDGFFLFDQFKHCAPVLCLPPEAPPKAPLSGIANDALAAARGARFEFGQEGA